MANPVTRLLATLLKESSRSHQLRPGRLVSIALLRHIQANLDRRQTQRVLIRTAGHLGNGEVFDRAMGAFAVAYADRNEREYSAFRSAIEAGTIEAHE